MVASKPELENGKDYILKFEGPYDTLERRAELTVFVEQAFARIPELAEKVVKARELNGSEPSIILPINLRDLERVMFLETGPKSM